jgi:kinesin family protein C2/C3
LGSAQTEIAVRCKGDNELIVSGKDESTVPKQYKFDTVFGPETSQLDVYREVQPLVESVVQGYHCCIFAYGQTGSGKTYTMDGGNSTGSVAPDAGINRRAVSTLFDEIETARRSQSSRTFSVQVSLLEIYNETLIDLFEEQGVTKSCALTITGTGVNTKVQGLTEIPASSPDLVLELLNRGRQRRVVSNNSVNEQSSRSHCIFIVKVSSEHNANGSVVSSHGQLVLVDLAGSERSKRTAETASETQMREAKSINQSLSELGNVIHALANKQKATYRNSKLTHMLQGCLGGSSKTLMFVQVSPASQDREESLCSLLFAERVRTIKASEQRQLQTSSRGERDALVAQKQQFAAQTKELASHAKELARKNTELEALKQVQQQAETQAVQQETATRALEKQVQVCSDDLFFLSTCDQSDDFVVSDFAGSSYQFASSVKEVGGDGTAV